MTMAAEVHVPVVGYEGLYTIGNLGTVTRVSVNGNPVKRIIKFDVDRKGYLRVGLSRAGHARTMPVHRLVAEAFLGPRPHGLTVNHKDGDKRNNSPGNLEYVTSAENRLHAIRLGLLDPGAGGKASAGIGYKLDRDDVIDIRLAVASGEQQKVLAKKYGVKPATIWEIVHRKIWRST